eukprot:jgi/Psemu1/32907/gm1.32907_g
MGIICRFSNHGLNCTTLKSSAPAQDLWSLTRSVIYGRNSNNPTLRSLLQCQIWLDSVAPEDPVGSLLIDGRNSNNNNNNPRLICSSLEIYKDLRCPCRQCHHPSCIFCSGVQTTAITTTPLL